MNCCRQWGGIVDTPDVSLDHRQDLVQNLFFNCAGAPAVQGHSRLETSSPWLRRTSIRWPRPSIERSTAVCADRRARRGGRRTDKAAPLPSPFRGEGKGSRPARTASEATNAGISLPTAANCVPKRNSTPVRGLAHIPRPLDLNACSDESSDYMFFRWTTRAASITSCGCTPPAAGKYFNVTRLLLVTYEILEIHLIGEQSSVVADGEKKTAVQGGTGEPDRLVRRPYRPQPPADLQLQRPALPGLRRRHLGRRAALQRRRHRRACSFGIGSNGAAGAEEFNAILQIGSREAATQDPQRTRQAAGPTAAWWPPNNGWLNVRNDLQRNLREGRCNIDALPGFYYKTFSIPAVDVDDLREVHPQGRDADRGRSDSYTG